MEKDPCQPCTSSFCKNPLIHLLNQASSGISETVTFAESLDQILENGVFTTTGSNICCPDCTSPNGFYYLGNYGGFLQLAEFYGFVLGDPDSGVRYPCCLNFQLSSRVKLDHNEAFGAKAPSCCNTDFTTALSNLYSTTDIESLISSFDITEASSFNNRSGIGIILNYLNSEFPDENVSEIFQVIYESGVVIKCKGCELIIADVDTFLTFENGGTLPD